MAIVKIGPAEEKLISEIEAFKQEYKERLKYLEDGLKIAEEQLPNDVKGEVKDIKKKIIEARGLVARLSISVDRITFLKDDNGEKFSVAWMVFSEEAQSHYQLFYGTGKEFLTEKQLVHAITSWQNEVLRSVVLFKQIAGYSYNSFCSKIEQHVCKIIHEYVNPNT